MILPIVLIEAKGVFFPLRVGCRNSFQLIDASDYPRVKVALEKRYIAFVIVSGDSFVFLELYEIFLCSSSVILSEEF